MSGRDADPPKDRSLFGIRIKYEENVFGIIAFVISLGTLIYNVVGYARAEVKLMPIEQVKVYFHSYPSGQYVKLALPVVFVNTGRPAAQAIIVRHSVSFALPEIVDSACAAAVAENYSTNDGYDGRKIELSDAEVFEVGPKATSKNITVLPGALRTTFFTRPGEVSAEEVLFSSATSEDFLRREFFECWVLSAPTATFTYTAQREGGEPFRQNCVVDLAPWRENLLDRPRNTISFPCTPG